MQLPPLSVLAGALVVVGVAWRYLFGGRGDVPTGSSGASGGLAEADPLAELSRRTTSSVRRCPHCAAANDPAFSYCRRCVRPLGE